MNNNYNETIIWIDMRYVNNMNNDKMIKNNNKWNMWSIKFIQLVDSMYDLRTIHYIK